MTMNVIYLAIQVTKSNKLEGTEQPKIVV